MRPLHAVIDLSALQHNFQQVRQRAPGRRIFAVVKANAYGHGAREVVTTLQSCADGFAVACIEEAAEIRALLPEPRLLLLEGCFEPAEWQMAAHLDLDVVVHDLGQVQALSKAVLSRPLNLWLKLDSGMHRLGFTADMLCEVFAQLQGQPGVRSLNLISHFACADLPEHPLNRLQQEAFADLSDLPVAQRSQANSAAILGMPAAHQDWVRPGIMLYGASPFAGIPAADLGLKAVMSLQAQLIAVRRVAAGETVGYGATWVATRPTLIGTVSCGYADGFPRHAPAGVSLEVAGRRVPLIGRVSMDMLAVDLSALPEARVGDPVLLWGDSLPVDQLAEACGTIGYELLTKVTARVPRRYRH